MSFSRTDWIFFDASVLYAPPFLGNNLLYRLISNNCSLLFCQEKVEPENTRVEKNEETRTTVICVTPSKQKPQYVNVYSSQSTATPLKELVVIPPLRINLLESSTQTLTLNDLTISVEPCHLKTSGMYWPDPYKEQSAKEYEIVDTKYKVRVPWPIMHMAKHVRNPETPLHWKISIVNDRNGRPYDFDADCEWSMTTVRVHADWTVWREACLERKMA